MRQTTLCFLIKPNQILLALKKRGFGVGKLNGVGGKLEKGETVEAAAVREMEEEICIKAKVQDLEKIAELHFTFHDKPEWDQLCHAFFLRTWEGDPRETEEMKPEWIPMHNIPYEKMWGDDIHWHPLALAGKKIKGRFHFSNDGSEILSYSIEESSGFK